MAFVLHSHKPEPAATSGVIEACATTVLLDIMTASLSVTHLATTWKGPEGPECRAAGVIQISGVNLHPTLYFP